MDEGRRAIDPQATRRINPLWRPITICVLALWISGLTFTSGLLFTRGLYRTDSFNALRTMSDEEMISEFGRVVVRPQEDYLALSERGFYEATGQGGFSTMGLYMPPMMAALFAPAALILILYFHRNAGKTVGVDTDS